MPLERIPIPGDYIRYLHFQPDNPTWHEVASVNEHATSYGTVYTTTGGIVFYYNHPGYPYEFRDPPKGKRKSGFGQFIGRIEASS